MRCLVRAAGIDAIHVAADESFGFALGRALVADHGEVGGVHRSGASELGFAGRNRVGGESGFKGARFVQIIFGAVTVNADSAFAG